LIIDETKKGKKFILITGGGYICREYQQAAMKVTRLTKDDRDWLGIHTTRLNAHLIKTIFRQYAHPRINKNPTTKADLTKHFAHGEKIMVVAGWRPGRSTDYVATILAQRLGAKTLINLSNIKYVYTKDPRKFPDAKIIKEINWADFRKIVGNKWDPGLNAPFDPVASKLAQEIGLEVIIAEGKNLKNLKDILEEKKFKGTRISGQSAE
jgi:uridylate kinase